MHASYAEPLAHLLVRGNGTADPVPLGWQAHPVTLEELTLAYLREPDAAALPGPARARDIERRAEVVGGRAHLVVVERPWTSGTASKLSAGMLSSPLAEGKTRLQSRERETFVRA